MPDLLSTSVTGLLAFQRALDVTGHNIANVNTPGYSRQIAEFNALPGQGSGNGYIGSGVEIATVKRIYDAVLDRQLKTSITGQARLATLDALSSQIDGLLANPETGLSPSMQSFFGSVQDVANDPASISARQAMLGEADGFLQRLRGIDARFRDIDSEIKGRLQQAIVDINRLATSIADLNEEIILAQSRVGQPPNDLLDQRDALVSGLAGQIGITTVPQDDGALNIFVGSGQTLVIGNQALTLGVQGNEFDPTRPEIVYKASAGDSLLDTRLTGGAVGGLLEFRAQMLDPAREMLGETALALAFEFNAQHASGMDLRGALGDDFFSISPPAVQSSSANTGLGVISAAVTNVSALTGGNYILGFDGAAYSLRDAVSGQVTVMTGSGTVADPFLAAGLSITVGAAPAAGDEFMIRPATNTAASLGLAVPDVQSIAIAAPTRTLAGSANIGDAAISPSVIVDRNDPALLTSALIEFTGPATYSIDGAGAFAYTSGDPITVNGSQFAISGSAQPGDKFTLEANLGGSGDNRNGLLLSQVQSRGVLRGGTVSINENYGSLMADVGGTANQVQSNLAAQNVILANVQDTVFSKSGVNLDEEAANLIRFQQAYQAMAQVVALTSTLFDTLIGAVRR